MCMRNMAVMLAACTWQALVCLVGSHANLLSNSTYALACHVCVVVCTCVSAAVVEFEPTITAKPSPFLMSDIMAKHNCVPARMLMVGDRLDTDVLWGLRTGMATLLVMTGGQIVCISVLCVRTQHCVVEAIRLLLLRLLRMCNELLSVETGVCSVWSLCVLW